MTSSQAVTVKTSCQVRALDGTTPSNAALVGLKLAAGGRSFAG
jgi:hypothetical protein